MKQQPLPLLQRFIQNGLKLWAFILLGTLGFMAVERWNFLDALYMTVITVTTVGYGEVHPLSKAGHIYVIILILVGAGFVLYVMSDMVELFMEVNLRLRHMQQKIVKLSDHQIVCGYGRTGHEVTSHFRQNDIPFVVIEADEERAREAEADGILVLNGDASTDEMLIEAQIDKARGIVCALPDDTQNTFIALSAKGLNENITIVSRAANPGSEAKLRRAGAHMVISPYVICGKRMATAVTHPLVTEFLDVVMHSPEYDLRMEQIKLDEGCGLIGNTLKDANIKAQSGAMILAVNQSGKLITNPSPDLVFGKGDELIALGTEHSLRTLALLSGTHKS